MKTIKSSKDITTLEVGDKVVFGDLEYVVRTNSRNRSIQYYLSACIGHNNTIFEILTLQKRDFVEKLGITADSSRYYDFPETKSLEALTAIVSALFKEYEKQNELPKTWEEFCERNTMGDKKFCLYDGVIIGTEISTNIVRDPILIESPAEMQAFRAFRQLRQLRKVYVKDWEPELGKKDYYGIVYASNGIKKEEFRWNHRNLSFPTEELAEQFLNNFKDLLEIAKPLL